MIFFGMRSKVYEGEVILDLQCPECQKNQFFIFGVLKYFHLYWIPTFMLGRELGAQCTHCRLALGERDLPSYLVANQKSKIFTPKRMLFGFIGIFVIAIAVAMIPFLNIRL